EFGRDRQTGVITLADEVLTPDSSRFWPADEWEPGHRQPPFDKQYLRDWLTSPEAGWDLSSGEPPPPLPDDVVAQTRAKYIEAYERDAAAVEKALREYNVTGVVHMAAKKAVGESVERPLFYYRENVDGLLSLLEAMDAADVRKMVYSSSAATFGMPDSDDPLT